MENPQNLPHTFPVAVHNIHEHVFDVEEDEYDDEYDDEEEEVVEQGDNEEEDIIVPRDLSLCPTARHA